MPARRPYPKFSCLQSFEDAQQIIERQWKEICRLQNIIRENKPKVDYYLHLVEQRPSFRSTQVADELGLHPVCCITS